MLVRWYIFTLPLEKRVKGSPGVPGSTVFQSIARASDVTHIDPEKVQVYIPIIKDAVDGQWKEVAIYEGYAFIGIPSECNQRLFFRYFDRPERMMYVLRTIIKRNKKPLRVPAEISEPVVFEIRAMCSGYVRKEIVRSPREGDRVRIIHGNFEGVDGEVISFNSMSKIARVRIFFLGTDVPVSVGILDLNIVGGSTDVRQEADGRSRERSPRSILSTKRKLGFVDRKGIKIRRRGRDISK